MAEAQALLKRVAAAGEAHDVRAYNILLKHHSRAGEPRAQAQVHFGPSPRSCTLSFNLLVVCVGASTTPHRKPSHSFHHRCHEGDATALRRALERMELAGVAPSPVTYNILVDGYVRGRDVGEARRIMARAAARGARLDAWAYSSLVRGAAQRCLLMACTRCAGLKF